MALSDLLRPLVGPRKRGSLSDRAAARQGIGKSSEWKRIADLPRRVLNLSEIPDLTPIWRINGCTGCQLCIGLDGQKREVKLRSIQSAALLEAEAAGGLLAPIGIGHGKTLLSLLLPDALNSSRAVLLVKPRLRKQLLEVDAPLYGRHFRLPMDRITVLKYSELERVATGISDLIAGWKWLAYLAAAICSPLDEVNPDLIVPDEAHMLLGDSARAQKYRAYLRSNPKTRTCPMSGTLGDRSIKRIAPLARAALRSLSPYPSAWVELDDWARATDVAGGDPKKYPMDPGALLDLCGPIALAEEMDALSPEQQQIFISTGPVSLALRQIVARRIIGRRVCETPGVASTPETSVGCALVVRRRPLEVPMVVTEALIQLRRTWTRPDGEELREAMRVAEVARQLALGFYYRWKWPGEPDFEWMHARADWGRFVRHTLRHVHRPGMHTPLAVQMAAERGELHSQEWLAWDKVRSRPKPPTEAVWISNFAVEDALKWMSECMSIEEPGLVWCDHDAFFDFLVQRGADAFGEGAAGDAILDYRGWACVAKMRCHGEGRNLQYFRRSLYVNPPAQGATWEQSLGRYHRAGQAADEVSADVYAHDRAQRSALARAIAEERREQDIKRCVRRLASAERVDLEFLDEGEPWPE